MSRARPKLDLHADRCDGCGRCVDQCREHAIRVGPGYIYVDWDRCDGCGGCVAFCDREAIGDRGVPAAPEAVGPAAAAVKAPRPARFGRHGGAAALEAVPEPGDAAAPAPDTVEGTPWTDLDAMVVIAVSVALVIGVQVVLALQPVTAAGRAGLLSAYYLITAGVIVALARLRHGRGFLDSVGLLDEPRTAAWVAAGLAVPATWLFSMLYRVAVLAAGWKPPAASRDVTALFGSDTGGMLLTALVVVLLGPFVEEIALRGVVLGAFGRRMSAAGAIVASSAVFAALHASLWSFVPLFVLGCALGWIVSRWRSLVPAFALHAAYNAVLAMSAFIVATQK